MRREPLESTSSVIDILDLTKVFRDFWHRPKVRAVDQLSLQVRQGEIFGLLGPNGSGKSTTLKIVLGLLHPSSGDVKVFGRSPRDVATKERIGYLPEESHLYSYLTARETLDFYAHLFNMNSATRRRRIAELLEMVGLTHAANRPVGEFSKGMARRVGLAQALINDPQLVILDEPTSGLDPVGCRQVKDLILTLAKRGKTVVLSSHLLADVEDVCDRVGILYSGRIRALGHLGALLEKQDRIQLTMPALQPEPMRELLSILRERLDTEPVVEHPSMNLEQFFLKVVAEAHRTSDYESGVSQGEGIAGYLQQNDS